MKPENIPFNSQEAQSRLLTGAADLEELDRLGLPRTAKSWLELNYPFGVALTAEVLDEMPRELWATLPSVSRAAGLSNHD
jgi:hypothetical protein